MWRWQAALVAASRFFPRGSILPCHHGAESSRSSPTPLSRRAALPAASAFGIVAFGASGGSIGTSAPSPRGECSNIPVLLIKIAPMRINASAIPTIRAEAARPLARDRSELIMRLFSVDVAYCLMRFSRRSPMTASSIVCPEGGQFV